MRSTTPTPLTLALASALLVTLAGCGGSDDDDDGTAPPPPPPPTQPVPVTLQGTVVVNQGIQNAVVCMDLNANSACDSGEPASAPTNASGAWQLTYDSSQISAAQVAAASLIAPITAGATDAAAPGQSATTQPYVLRQVPGKSGQINPLTTLVAQGMAGGMSEGAARMNSAQQLGIAEAKIDNYQDDPATDPAQVQDTARTLAAFIASALEHDKVLQVGDPAGASAALEDVLTRLAYEDAGNYETTVLAEQARAAGSAQRTYTQQVTKVAAGAPVTDVRTLHPSLYLTPTGWKRCDNTTVHSATLGSPNLSAYCVTQQAISYQSGTDIGGQPMAQVITTLQATPASNPINRDMPTGALLTAVGSATFPAGAQLIKSTRLLLAPPLFISDTRTQFIAQAQASTLEELVAARQASNVNLATSGGSLSLGLGATPDRNLRVAFTGVTSPTDGTVQYYDCALSPADVASNCSATNTGTYHIDTVGGVRVMRFAGYAATPASSQTNFYAEVKNTSTGDYIYRVRQAKPVATATDTYRLNGTAWAALKAQLGLQN